jgi:FKBP-type peptidyl-prolyl cis-trans isomerase
VQHAFATALRPLAPALCIVGIACGGGGESSPQLTSFEDSASYAVGASLGARWGAYIDGDKMLHGFTDAAAQQEALNRFQQMQLIDRLQVRMADPSLGDRSDENLRAGAIYRRENAARPGVTTTESGLQYEVLEQGSGPKPGPGSRVRVQYRGTLIDGSVFDSSSAGGATFILGRVVPGFAEAIQLMSVGSKFRVVMPPTLAYGTSPEGPGGPNATLIFDIELLEILD